MSSLSPLSPTILDVVAGRGLLEEITPNDVDQAFYFEVAELLLSLAGRSSATIPREDLLRLSALSMRSDNSRALALSALAEVAEVADRVACKYAVFKGPANAAVLYEDPSERPFNDVDIVVGFDGTDGLEQFFVELGREHRSACALVALARSGDPIHEVSLRVGGVDIDVHFNPFGMIAPLRNPSRVATEFTGTFELGNRSLPCASPELSLLISSVNLIRKGGGALWVVADMARLVQGRAGDLDWDKFTSLARAEGLEPLAGQALRLINDDLGVQVPSEVRAVKQSWWGPQLGEGTATKGVLRRGTFSILHRDPVEPMQTLNSIRRWYLPPKDYRVARSTTGSTSLFDHTQRSGSAVRAYLGRLRGPGQPGADHL